MNKDGKTKRDRRSMRFTSMNVGSALVSSAVRFLSVRSIFCRRWNVSTPCRLGARRRRAQRRRGWRQRQLRRPAARRVNCGTAACMRNGRYPVMSTTAVPPADIRRSSSSSSSVKDSRHIEYDGGSGCDPGHSGDTDGQLRCLRRRRLGIGDHLSCCSSYFTRCHNNSNYNNKNARRSHISAKANLVPIRTPDPDYFHNLAGTFLSEDTSTITFLWRSDQFSRRYESNCEKCLNSEADDFRKLIIIIIITFISGNKAHMTEKTHNEIKTNKQEYTQWHKT